MVSIIIPYNKDRGFLNEAFQSINNQTYRNFEVIEQKGNYTLGRNFNDGLRRSKGEFIKILAEDDLLFPNCLQDLVNGIGDADFITAHAINFNKNQLTSYTSYPSITLEEMLVKNRIHGGVVMYRRSGFKKYGLMDESLTTAEEYDLHLKWMSKGATQAFTNSVVYKYRLWEGSKSQGKTNDRARKKYINTIKDRYR